ncbi:uncharacterized protein AB9W97_012499 [Spinachia spinachia]
MDDHVSRRRPDQSGSGPLTVVAYCQIHPAPPCIHSRSGASVYSGGLKSLAGICSSALNEGVSKPLGCTTAPETPLHQVQFKAQLSAVTAECVCIQSRLDTSRPHTKCTSYVNKRKHERSDLDSWEQAKQTGGLLDRM